MLSRKLILISILPAALFGAVYAGIFSGIGWMGPAATGGKFAVGISLAAGIMLPMIQHFFLHIFFGRFLAKEKSEIIDRILHTHSYLRERERSSSLLQKLHVDFPAFIEGQFYAGGEFSSAIAQFAVLASVVGWLAPRLLVGIFCVLTVGVAVTVLFRMILSRLFEARREAETKMFYAEKDFVDGLEYLKVNPTFHNFRDRIVAFTVGAIQLDRKVGAIQDIQIALSGGMKFLAVAALSTVILLPFKFNPENFYWLYLFLGAGSTLNMAYQRLRTAQLHGQKCKEFFDKAEIREKRSFGGEGVCASSLLISFDRKKFSPDLGPLFLDWQERDRVLIKAASGRGKTTLMKALMGLHSFWQGEIRIGAGTIGYLAQEPFFLEGATLAENLGIGSIETKQAEKLLNKVGLESLARPEGFNTILGPTGVSPSKGQWKRIALVRELLRNPRILFLDEPLSGLDTYSAIQLFHCIRSDFSECLMVVAEHREEILSLLEPTKVMHLEQRRKQSCLSSTVDTAIS